MDAGLEKSSYTNWWWNSHNSSIQSPCLQSALSALLAVIKQEDGDSFAEGNEVYHGQKPELVKRVEDLHRLHCLLAEHVGQFSTRSSPSSIPMEQPDCAHGIGKALRLEQSDSNPESSVEDPELEMYTIPLKEPGEITDARCSDLVRLIGGMNEGSNLLQTFEHRVSCSEQTLGLIEENCRQLNELTKRNEEKREAIKDLWSQMEKLVKDNQALHEQNNKLIKENWALCVELQKRIGSSSLLKKHNVSLSRLKTLFMSAFRARDSP